MRVVRNRSRIPRRDELTQSTTRPMYERMLSAAMRILLVEDERKVASFIARALRENTYAVDVAETGQKALELGADVSYDAILLDVRLPDLSGLEVCREFRQRGIESPVLMLTARGLVEQRVEGLDAGADDRSEEHTSELQSLAYLVCRLLL